MKKLLFLSIALCASLLINSASSLTTSVKNYYAHIATATVNGVTGYVLNETSTLSGSTLVTESTVGSVTIYVGWRIWHTDSNNLTTELTTGTPVAQVSRAVDGEGLQSATWTPPQTNLNVGWDALKFIVYIQLDGFPWVPKATFTTERLVEKALNNETWTFYAYTKRLYSFPSTSATFYWGQGYNSRIEDVTFTDPSPFQGMGLKLEQGDFVAWLFFPYVNLIGSMFYGLMMLLINVPIYNRYHSFKPILIMFILFGGGSGIFTLLIPEVGMSIGWVFLLIGLTALLYQTTR